MSGILYGKLVVSVLENWPDVTYVTKCDDYWNETVDADSSEADGQASLVSRIMCRFGYAKMK